VKDVVFTPKKKAKGIIFYEERLTELSVTPDIATLSHTKETLICRMAEDDKLITPVKLLFTSEETPIKRLADEGELNIPVKFLSKSNETSPSAVTDIKRKSKKRK
jgi:hypothetical protein